MRIELSCLNAMASDNTHTLKLRDEQSGYYLLSVPLTKISFPFNPELEPSSLILMADIQHGDSMQTTLLDSDLTLELYNAAVQAGFKADETKLPFAGLSSAVCLVAPFPSVDSIARADEERMRQIGVNVNQPYVNIDPKTK
ncbi:hypothetical protein ACPV5G_21015 [Photobacterium damselae]|uniref:hypothetical protein n=1 Tax=Photobacterium damselae TaxID=38293 RepID=UPI004068EE53